MEQYVGDAAATLAASRSRRAATSISLRQLASGIVEESSLTTGDDLDFHRVVRSVISEMFEADVGHDRTLIEALADAVTRHSESARIQDATSPSKPVSSSSASTAQSVSPHPGAGVPECMNEDESGQQDEVVRNVVTGYLHRVLLGPPAPAEVWLAFCGWRFGQAQHDFAAPVRARRCRKCWRGALSISGR